MRNLWLVLSTVLFGCNLAYSQSSGCATFLNPGDVTCSVGSCNGDITMQTPMGGYGYYAQGYTCQPIQCCGTGNYPFCAFDGGQCYWTKLSDPTVRQNLIELAHTEDLLIVSCKGRYQPLTAVLEEEPFVLRPVHKLPGLIGGGR